MDIKPRSRSSPQAGIQIHAMTYLCADFLTYPLESLRVRMQYNPASHTTIRGSLWPLYKGLWHSLLKTGIFSFSRQNALQLTSLVFTGDVGETTYPRKFCNLAASILLSLALSMPFELLKVRRIVGQDLTDIRISDLKALWRGFNLSVISLIFFGGQELFLSPHLRKYCVVNLNMDELSIWPKVVSQSITAIFGSLLTNPIEAVRIQYMGEKSSQVLSVTKKIFQNRQYYKGALGYTLRNFSFINAAQLLDYQFRCSTQLWDNNL